MRLKLKKLKEFSISQSYVDWFSDAETTRYSDNQYYSFTLEGQKKYVSDCFESEDIDLFGIFDRDIHIGNIQISGLSSVHQRAEISYIVGEKNYWGKGVGSFAVSKIITKARKFYRLNKLYAGLAECNIGSRRVLEKNGFSLEGKRLNHLFYRGKFYDQLDFGLLL